MSIRSKILTAVAGLAALCVAVVATPGQGSQARADTSHGYSITALISALTSHGY